MTPEVRYDDDDDDDDDDDVTRCTSQENNVALANLFLKCEPTFYGEGYPPVGNLGIIYSSSRLLRVKLTFPRKMPHFPLTHPLGSLQATYPHRDSLVRQPVSTSYLTQLNIFIFIF